MELYYNLLNLEHLQYSISKMRQQNISDKHIHQEFYRINFLQTRGII